MGNQAIQVSLALGAPLLLVALVVGLVISIFQAATQINEATLSFIPKLLAVFATMVIAGPWMLNQMLDYIRALFMSIPQLIG
jgi:flagellar biosynthetic protein FliQ